MVLSEKSKADGELEVGFEVLLIGREAICVCVVANGNAGDVGVDVVALSMSARRHACEQ